MAGEVNQGQFYDDIAEYYDLIYADWEGSMLRHGAAIAEILDGRVPSRTRILDVSAGIGTQVLPLAALGYEVVRETSLKVPFEDFGERRDSEALRSMQGPLTCATSAAPSWARLTR